MKIIIALKSLMILCLPLAVSSCFPAKSAPDSLGDGKSEKEV